MDLVKTEFEDGIAHVVLSRPDKLNAVSMEMLDAVIDAAHALQDKEDLRCVILSGKGRAFCAGLDLASISTLMGHDLDALLIERTHGQNNRFQEFALAWRALPVPVIAAVQGVCIGAGLQLALGADIRVAHPEAKLAVMEMKWGLIPDMGGMVLLPKLLRSDILRKLTYTAEMVEAPEAIEIGLITEVSEDPLARAKTLAALIANQSPSAIRAAKRLIAKAEEGDEKATLRAESEEQAALIGKPDQLAAIQRGMAKR